MARKIENSLALDYPADRIEIVVVSDGSSDADRGHRPIQSAASACWRFAKNRGKVAALNAAVPELHGEIIVFSDASAILPPDSVGRLVENFADPSVGAVSGRYRVVKPNEVNIGVSEDLYWKYEAFRQDPRVAPGVHAGRARPSARHPKGAVSLSARRNN